MAIKYLDGTGLAYFWSKIKAYGDAHWGGGSTVLDYYPVGSYYETSDASFDPNVSWGGTWLLDSAGRVTVSQDASDTAFDVLGETGGASTSATGDHQLIASEIPAHTHGSETLTGSFRVRSCNDSGKQTTVDSPTGIVSIKNHTATYAKGWQGTSSYANYPSVVTITATHTHDSVGGNGTHNHGDVSTLQPYIVVKRWHRTA